MLLFTLSRSFWFPDSDGSGGEILTNSPHYYNMRSAVLAERELEGEDNTQLASQMELKPPRREETQATCS